MPRTAQCSNSATVPRPPSAQMLTIARLRFGSVASSLTASLKIRAPVAANGCPSATLPPFRFIRSRGKASERMVDACLRADKVLIF